MTLKAVGMKMGISRTRVAYMVGQVLRRDRRLAEEEANPTPPHWAIELKFKTRCKLERAGFSSKESCYVFAADSFDVWSGAIVFKDSDYEDWQRWSLKRFTPTEVNEIRAWIGCAPYEIPAKPATAKRLESAKRLLEKNGWHVSPPAI